MLSDRFGPAIKALRKRRGLTQGALAELCSVSRSAIGQFERGLASPSLETLGRILDAIDADLSDLQDELDRQSGAQLETVEEAPEAALSIEIGGVQLSREEVDRRINAAFDRLVRRSVEGGRKAEAPATRSGVRVD
jgi:transcriptional regulator with XRE-family HTH domain